MLKQKQTIVPFFLFAALVCIYVVGTIKVQEMREKFDPTQSISALLVKPEVLEIAGGEFRFLLADYMLLKASVYLGGRWTTPESSKRAVAALFRQSANLDPWFFQTCYLTQGYLPWWGDEMLKDGLEILEIFKEHRDWDWEPGYYIGFDYFYFLKDNLTASKYLMEASEKPGAGNFLGLLGARLAQRGGQTKASIAFLQSMAENTKNEKAKEEINRRIMALKGILKLEKAIVKFKSMFFNHPPDTLEQLVESGILEELPVNSARKDGRYLYEDGKIDF